MSIFTAILLSLLISGFIIYLSLGYPINIWHIINRKRKKSYSITQPVLSKERELAYFHNKLPHSFRAKHGIIYDQYYPNDGIFTIKCSNEKWGAVQLENGQARFIVTPKYYSTGYYPEHKVVLAVNSSRNPSDKRDQDYDVYSKTGELISTWKNVYHISAIVHNAIIIEKKGLKGLLNTNFEQVIECEYDLLHPLEPGIFKAQKWDITNKRPLQYTIDFNAIINSSNETLVSFEPKVDILYHAKNGKVVINENFGKYSLVDYINKLTTALPYHLLIQEYKRSRAKEPLYRTVTQLVDRSEDVFELEYRTMTQYQGKWGVINIDGEEIIPNQYDYLDLLPDGNFRVGIGTFEFKIDEEHSIIEAKGVKWGIVDAQNNVLVPLDYIWAYYQHNSGWMVVESGILRTHYDDEDNDWYVPGEVAQPFENK